jgi:hypothetical protein
MKKGGRVVGVYRPDFKNKSTSDVAWGICQNFFGKFIRLKSDL